MPTLVILNVDTNHFAGALPDLREFTMLKLLRDLCAKAHPITTFRRCNTFMAVCPCGVPQAQLAGG
eukprot:2357041-Amphidinium_carterae.1